MKRIVPEEERQRNLRRIVSLEKHIVLPARIALIVSCVAFLWPALVADIGARGVGATGGASLTVLTVFKWATGGYAALSAAYWLYLFVFSQRLKRQWLTKAIVFVSALADNLFLGVLVNAAMIVAPEEYYLLGGGPEASLFWAYCALVVRNTLLFSDAVFGSALGSLYVIGYLGAILVNMVSLQERPEGIPTITDAEERLLIFRALVLGLVTVCSSVIYRLIQRRRKELDDAHERAIRSERLDMAGMLAGQVAHELKNPLSVMTNAAFLLRRSKEGLGEKLRHQVEIIEEEIRRADRIIRDLLDYAKLAEGKIEAVLVNDCIEDSLNNLRHEIDARQIRVEKNYSFDLPFLFIDPGQLRQVFSNLLLNACEAIGQVGTISVSTNYSLDGFIEISIGDTGKGMSEDVLAKVFKAFYTTKERGTGMGLSIVQNVVRAYDGEINASSQPGEGTVFRLRFPARMAKRFEEERTRAAEPQAAAKAAAHSA